MEPQHSPAPVLTKQHALLFPVGVPGDYPTDGSVLMPMASRGNDSASPFITIKEDGAMHGFVVFHVEQRPDAMPVPYPFAIALVVSLRTFARGRGGRGRGEREEGKEVKREGGKEVERERERRDNPKLTHAHACIQGNNAAVTDVEILNAWNGVSAVAAHRHYIARIQGQPLNIGVFVDETYDVRATTATCWIRAGEGGGEFKAKAVLFFCA